MSMGKKVKQYTAWEVLFTLMRKDKRFAIAIYLILGSMMLFASLYLFTGLEIFKWLAYVPLAVALVIGVGSELMKRRNHFRRRNGVKPDR